MNPTSELRWIERKVYDETTNFYGHTVCILQQKWAGFVSNGPLKIDVEYQEEWRDVPVKKENNNEYFKR